MMKKKKEKRMDRALEIIQGFFLMATLVVGCGCGDSPSILAATLLMMFCSLNLLAVTKLIEWREEQKEIRRQRILEKKAGF